MSVLHHVQTDALSIQSINLGRTEPGSKSGLYIERSTQAGRMELRSQLTIGDNGVQAPLGTKPVVPTVANGDMTYWNYISFLNQAIDIKKQYAGAIHAYNQTAIETKFPTIK